MSADIKQDEASLRAVKVLAPSGKLPKYTGIISLQEHIILSEAATSAFILTNCQKHITNDEPEKIEQVFVDAIQFWVDDYNSRTGSRDGVRSKQLSKISGSINTGMPVEDEKRSRWDKILGRKKGVVD